MKSMLIKRAVRNLLLPWGGRVLRNEIIPIHGVQLVGLRYMKADEDTLDLHPSDDQETVKSALSTLNINPNKPAIIVHHSPMGIRYIAEKGADLVLSGHTHAGQVFPGTLLAPFFFTFNRGLQHMGDTQVFVSQGAGTYLAPLRSGSQNEINLIKINALDPGDKS